MVCKYFLQFHLLCFLLCCFLYCAEDFWFDIIPLVHFHFCCLCFEVVSKKPFPRSMSWSFFPKVSSRIFSFRPFIHFAMIFKIVCDKDPISLFFYVNIVFPAWFIEETILSSLCVLGTFAKDELTINVWIYFQAFCFVPLVYIPICMAVPHCFNYFSFAVYLKSKQFDVSSFVFLAILTTLAI